MNKETENYTSVHNAMGYYTVQNLHLKGETDFFSPFFSSDKNVIEKWKTEKHNFRLKWRRSYSQLTVNSTVWMSVATSFMAVHSYVPALCLETDWISRYSSSDGRLWAEEIQNKQRCLY